MAACRNLLETWQVWRWPGRPHGDDTQQRILPTTALHASLTSNPIKLDFKIFSPIFTHAALAIVRERRSSTSDLPASAFLQFPSRAQHSPRGGGGKETIESNCSVRSRTSPSGGLPLRLGVIASAIAPGLASPEGTPSFSRKEHEEHLEQFYSENEALFADETWGVLEEDGTSKLGREQLRLVLAAGRVQRGSRVLVWGGSAAFVRELCVATSPDCVTVTHFSMTVLGGVKEMNDDVCCWLGNVESLPDSYGPFDAVFLNSLIVTAYSPADLLRSVAGLCNPGARIVISYPQGKEDLVVCRDKNPQLVIQNLPDTTDLERMINLLPLNLVELQDEPSLYLTTLEVEETLRTPHTQNGTGEVSGQQTFPLRARGSVVPGFGRGSKQMGIPTANLDPLELPPEFLGLSKGVYFGWARQDSADELDGGVYKMVMNIGERPTFADGEGVTVETHILHGYSCDFYGKGLSVLVLGFLRDEMRFSSPGELVQRIKADISNADRLLGEAEMLQYASDAWFVRE